MQENLSISFSYMYMWHLNDIISLGWLGCLVLVVGLFGCSYLRFRNEDARNEEIAAVFNHATQTAATHLSSPHSNLTNTKSPSASN